ncbi:hypothetical protein EV361DRAFT_947681 [Lentinula raphanica]|uniref:Uncharacterized protein n=1 Tax=Lentinula raphanica TaxID=153919 RepID=A0AA38UKY4_9AGAR|nr:hypothetical protein F5878DRAFT_675831 [Lentinula raphanica]KAJ3973703.1 hypothetical protein EV361DRAFT_947681 [Lentinula raphanica]
MAKVDVTYVERAIQTEPPRLLSRSTDDKAVNLHEKALSPKNEHLETAYSHLSSLSISKRDYKLSQLNYQKPSEINVSSKRIVSLPETSPPSRINSDTVRNRVVSMTEQVQLPLVSSDADNSLSSDCFESSLETSRSQLSHSDLGTSVRRARPRTSAYPQTPSPPSSPESIMIIGNNMQVPNSFLRHNVLDRPKMLPGDDNDWRTWTSSPPKPIPALHGPLSLPYARCPSGAEGTIIEGEDMARTIWGLGQDAHVREQGTDTGPNPSPISAQKPESMPQTQLPARSSTSSDIIKESREARTKNDLYFSPSIPSMITVDTKRIHELHAKDRKIVRGLGLEVCDDTNPQNSNLERINVSLHLKASAAEFVPKEKLPTHSQPSNNVEPPARSHYIAPKPQLPAIDLAYEYRAQQEGKTPLLDTPSSTSSIWSPYLPTPLPLHAEVLPDVWNSDDVADELRRFIYDRIGQQNLSPADLKQISELARSLNLDRNPAYSSSLDTLATPKFSRVSTPSTLDLHHPGPPPNTPLPPIPSQRSGLVPSEFPTTNSSTSLSTGTASRQHNLPRSVPMTRLLQRRLSVVPEEPSSTLAENLPPPSRIERTTFGGANPQHYKPYFAHARGQQVQRLPDISNHVGGSIRSYPLNSTRGEPYTAGNLEVGEFVQVGSPMMSDNNVPKIKSSNQGGVILSNAPYTVVTQTRNGLANDRTGSTDSIRSDKLSSTAVKETSRKKTKPKVKRQVTGAGTSLPSAGETWVSGAELEAWLA